MTIPYDFSTNVVDECVKVTDNFNGTETTLQDPVCVGVDDNPKTFTYSHEVPVPTWNCTFYSNTATFTTNDTATSGSASQKVQVCGPAKLADSGGRGVECPLSGDAGCRTPVRCR